MKQAVNASKRYPVAAAGCPAPRFDASNTPPSAAVVPQIANEMIRTRRTLIPDSLAATGFPPIAYICRPSGVCVSISHVTAMTRSITQTR